MHPAIIAALISAGSSLLGGILGGDKSAQPRTTSSLTPQQRQLSSGLTQRIRGQWGYPTQSSYSGSASGGAPTDPYGGLRTSAQTALQSILGGEAYGGLTTPDPRFAATYGTMGLNAVQMANQAILGRESQRLGAVPAAQNVWSEADRMALQMLGIPMTSTYLEEPAANPLATALGGAIPGITQWAQSKWGT